MQSRHIHKISQQILTEAKNPKLYPNARYDIHDAQKSRKTPSSMLQEPLGNVTSSAIRTEVYIGFNYVPTPDRNDLSFHENYVIVPKGCQQYLTQPTSIKFVIFAQNNIKDAILEFRFFGNKPTFRKIKHTKFESINYDSFKKINFSLPDRYLPEKSKTKSNLKTFKIVQNDSQIEEQEELSYEGSGSDIVFNSARYNKLPPIVQKNIMDVNNWKNSVEVKKKLGELRVTNWKKKQAEAKHKKEMLQNEKDERVYLSATRFERKREEVGSHYFKLHFNFFLYIILIFCLGNANYLHNARKGPKNGYGSQLGKISYIGFRYYGAKEPFLDSQEQEQIVDDFG